MRKWLLAFATVLLASCSAHAQTSVVIANAGTTGTTNGLLAKLTGAPSTAVKTATGDTSGIIGVVVSGAGTTGNAIVAVSGIASCTFDASGVTAGHFVINSTVTAGDCADGGATYPTGSQPVGVALATVGSGAANIVVTPPVAGIATVGAVSSVTGTTGQLLCTPTSGAVVCSEVAANTLAHTYSAANSFTGATTFAEVHGSASAPSLTSNNYTAVQADCGTLVKLPAGTTGATVTLPNLNVQCTIVFKTTAARAYLFNITGSGTKQNSQGFYTTRGTAAGDTVIVTIMTPSSSAALWDISGDVTS